MNVIKSLVPPPVRSGSAQLAGMLRRHGPRFVEYARQANPEIVRLEMMLTGIEIRLGTAEERASDSVACRDLAHRLASLYCIGALVDFAARARALREERSKEPRLAS